MEKLLLILFGVKKPNEVNKVVKKKYPIRELNQSDFQKWCEEFRVGSLSDRRVVDMGIG